MKSISGKKFVRQLLAATCLTAATAATAGATTFNESSLASGDFPNLFASATVLPVGTNVVIGAFPPTLTDIDFFKFVNLLAGSTFTVTAATATTNTAGLLAAFNSANVQFGSNQFYVGPPGTQIASITGVVPADGMLVVKVADNEGGTPYTVNLTQVTPEPSTLGLAAAGLAAAALAARRKSKS